MSSITRKSVDTANNDSEATGRTSLDIFADLEATLEEVAEENPRLEESAESSSKSTGDLK